ncbi:MAG: septation protein IspZ [Pseudomonadales bacterium]|nr:septation protein IspZ [Pseudomonadales bacterium]
MKPKPASPESMKQFLDFLPIVIFFVAYYVLEQDLLLATAILIGAQTLQVAVVWAIQRKLDRQMQIQFWLVLVLGGLTLALGDGRFIMWKPTLVNWLLACAVGGSTFIGERNLIERLLGAELTLPASAWRTLAWGWTGAFFLSGALNLVVAYNFSEAFWVNYKLFGGLALTFTYVVISVVYLARSGYLAEQQEADEADQATKSPAEGSS